MKRIVLTLVTLGSLFATYSWAQDTKTPSQSAKIVLQEVKGRVVDAATGEPAPGVQVQAYNNRLYSAMTDDNGEYTVKIPAWVTSLIYGA